MSKSINIGEFKYTLNRLNNNIFYYRCNRFRFGCKATTILKENIYFEKRIHTCKKEKKGENINVENCIENFIKMNAPKLNLRPQIIFENLLKEINNKFKKNITNFPSKTDIKKKIRKMRDEFTTKELYLVQISPYCLSNKNTIMLQRNWFGVLLGKYERFMLWAGLGNK